MLVGRNAAALEETKAALSAERGVETITSVTDIADEAAVKKLAAEAGTWDVLVLNTGFTSAPVAVAAADVSEWWTSFGVGKTSRL